ncbi:DCC1-like thiol-disulfide oxidoreductase family protein [Chondromyces apiculatus]|uniref:HTTM-like domain-containing protein n=1 Tax=Chondromyces apiculatus DSM 436 TaxID=1192034 RepID=A0A017T4A4_9BACT|nr:DCC1-like thiol-disulfide oxidoreductase family protein [Chondromyces apiculatus]EYF04034.1 Hypothetical protein CAP_4908 [Chondromyces apiculatus DSM 436]
MLTKLRDHFARIDARSLGLFRVVMGLVLVLDVLGRLQVARDFYANEGVLPNHNHLFNLRGKEEVWSLFHALSTQGEAYVGLLVALFVFLAFLVGWRTRVFHVLALVFAVSLTARNTLAEGVGSYASIALLAFTAFLPCGSRFSLDSLRASMALRDEQTSAELNDRRALPERTVNAVRLPGWSPVTVAAFGVLLQIVAIHACSALQKSGEAWRDGSALHYALHGDLWVSGLGAWVRGALGAGVLKGLTFGLRYAEIVIPVLLVVPVAFRWTRLAAAALMVVHGLVLALLFELGLYGGALVAAAALVVPVEAWAAFERSPKPGRMLTVIYDADCGMCLWLARLLKRFDLRTNITFQGNDDLSAMLVRRAGKKGVERAPLPAEITEELVQRTVVVVDVEGRVFLRTRAVAEIVTALPLGILAAPLRVVAPAFDVLYNAVATKRHRISVLMGKTSCAIPAAPARAVSPEVGAVEGAAGLTGEGAASEADEGSGTGDVADAGEVSGAQASVAGEAEAPGSAGAVALVHAVPEVSPARRTVRHVAGGLRELSAALVLAAMVVQTARQNPVPAALAGLPQPPLLATVSSFSRMLGRWDVMAPEPRRTNEMMIVDAQTRAGEAMDLFTGSAPEVDLAARGPLRMGQLWSSYLDRVRRPEFLEFQRAFRDYLGKGGPLRSRTGVDPIVAGLDAYWVVKPIAPPGGAPEGEAVGAGTREKLFTHGRGGLGTGMDAVPLARPGVRR